MGKNETGEIFIRGPLIMKGYYGNQEATAEAIDKDGWLRSGDVGCYDNDGQLYITDRAKEIMKNGVWQVRTTRNKIIRHRNGTQGFRKVLLLQFS